MALTADRTESGQEADPTRVDDGNTTDGDTRRRVTDSRIVLASVVLAVLPFVVAVVRGIRRGWQPTGDDAYTAIRAWDVFTDNPPLLGTWSSASNHVGHQINHPGPLHFDLLAIPVRLFGHAPGTALGTALVNIAAVVGVAWLMKRRMGPGVATLATGCCALLAWSMGSEMLYEPWSQYAPLWPFVLFVVAVWCAVAGDPVAWPVMVGAGSVALQTHLSYALLVPGLATFAVAVGVMQLLVRRPRDPDVGLLGRRRRAVHWGLVTLAVVVVTWAQPLVENVTADGEGNLVALARSSDVESPNPTVDTTLRVVGGTVALPPAWLPPSYGSPAFDVNGEGSSVVACTVALVVLTAALALLTWRSWRRGRRSVAAGGATALVGLALGLASASRAPVYLGVTPNYFRFLWPLAMVVWLALTLLVVDEARHQLAPRSPAASRDRRHWVGGWAAPGLALTAVAAVATLPRVDNGVSTPQWADEATVAIDDDIVAAVDDRGGGPVLVQVEDHVAVYRLGPAVFFTLQAADVPFLIDGPTLARQLGTARRYQPGEADWRLVVKGGEEAEAGADEELVAEWRDLSDAERRELNRLDAELADRLREHGLPLTDEAREVSGLLHFDDDLSELRDQAANDPAAALDNPLLRLLWDGSIAVYVGRPLVATAPETIPEPLLDRWADLKARSDLVVRVYMAPL